MLPIKLVNNHDDINVTEWDEAQGEYAQGTVTFSNQIQFVSTKKFCDCLWIYPYEYTSDNHCYGDETK